MRPKRATFQIATFDGGRETRTGYVAKRFAVHKDRTDFFWTVTHLATGVSVVTYPVLENRASALAHLEKIERDGLPEHQETALVGAAWGLGL